MTKVKLNIGCGMDIKKSSDEVTWINIDNVQDGNIDKVIDFDYERIGTFYNINSVDEIYCSHFLEHIDVNQQLDFILDCIDVLKPGGKLILRLPNTMRSQVFHKNFGFTKDYFMSLSKTNDRCLQNVDIIEIKSKATSYKMGFMRFILNNYLDLREWLTRRFSDEYTYEFRKK